MQGFFFLVCVGSPFLLICSALLQVETVDAWDGSDAEMPEEEFSLEDIMGDEF